MKISSSVLVSLLSVSILTPSLVVAEPVGVNVTVTCPGISGNQNVLTNFGDYIAGYGSEVIDGIGATPIYFKSAVNLSNLPTKLASYRNDSVNYDSTSGQVSCFYAGADFVKEPSFSVSYTMTNGKGALVTKQTQNSITFKLPIGLNA